MIADIMAGVVRANLAASLVVLIVIALRRPVRAAFGARVAYALWIAPLLAAGAVLLPQPEAATALSVMALTVTGATSAALGEGQAASAVSLPLVFGLWLLGAAVATAVLLRRQARFVASLGSLRLQPESGPRVYRAERNGVGPVVLGVLRPRIVTPADFEDGFGVDERCLILAHERVHVARGDTGVNALAAAIQCLAWFNPLIHLAVRLLRIDQELACDAVVLTGLPALRRLYAEVLLKTQLATQPLPLGCHWPPAAQHPLKERIVMLKSPLPAPRRRALGLAVVAAVSLTGAITTWAAQPSQDRTVVDPDWSSRPTGADLARLYPADARVQGLGGSAVMRCQVERSGALSACVVLSEAPHGAGFGGATLQMAPLFQMKPKSVSGKPVAGGVVHIPVKFMIPTRSPAGL